MELRASISAIELCSNPPLGVDTYSPLLRDCRTPFVNDVTPMDLESCACVEATLLPFAVVLEVL